MGSKRSREIILKYIRERGGDATKNDVVEYMDGHKEVREEDRTSRVTTLNLIRELESAETITVAKGRRGQSHTLLFNNKSDFNILMNAMNMIDIYLNEVRNIFLVNVEKIESSNSKPSSSFDKHFRNLIHMALLAPYTRIGSIASQIDEYVRLVEDREILYLRMAQVLTVAGRLNKLILLTVGGGLYDMSNELKEIKKMQVSLAAADLIEGIVRSTGRNLSFKLIQPNS